MDYSDTIPGLHSEKSEVIKIDKKLTLNIKVESLI
jgi:hypothetical protein